MTLHLIRGRWWIILFPPTSVFVTARRYCIIRAIGSLIPALTHPQWYTLLHVVNLMQGPRGSPDTVTRAEVLT